MKKLLMAFVCVFALVALAACGTTNDNTPTGPQYKLGMGVVVSKPVYGKWDGMLEISATVATVVTDNNGKILACRIDVAQDKLTHGENGLVPYAGGKTKMEKQDEYGMAGNTDNDDDGVMLEWYEQTYAFETFVKGMTATEVANIKTQTLENGYVIADVKELLEAGCSMQITEFMAAVVKACNDEQAMGFDVLPAEYTLGVSATTSDNGTTALEAKTNTDFAATVVDAEGKIVAALNDALQTAITVTADKKVEEQELDFRTKREKKTDYGMEQAGIDNDKNGVALEWYLQSMAFSKHVVGMTATQVSEMGENQIDANHAIPTDKDLLDAGCSMSIPGLKAIVVKAVNNAR